MHYIVVDFEWNQPISFQSASYKRMKDKLLFEIIQIGATKINQNFEIVDTFRQNINPHFFRKIHPRIKRITGLSNEILADAPEFPEAYEKFINFCGSDICFLTWGNDDVSVFYQNIDCFEIKNQNYSFYNVQRLFSCTYKLGKQQVGLKTALEQMKINEDNKRNFHDAADDAYYTARVFNNLETKESITEYLQQPRKLMHAEKIKYFRITHNVPTVSAGLNLDCVKNPECPLCHSKCKYKTELVPQTPSRFIALVKCDRNRLYYLQLRFIRLRNKSIGMSYSISSASKKQIAYVHTKQYQNKINPEINRFKTDFNIKDITEQGNMPFEFT